MRVEISHDWRVWVGARNGRGTAAHRPRPRDGGQFVPNGTMAVGGFKDLRDAVSGGALEAEIAWPGRPPAGRPSTALTLIFLPVELILPPLAVK